MEGRVKRQVTFLAPGTQGDVEPLRLVAQAIAETGRVSVLFACDALYHHDEEEEGSSREAAIVYMPLTSAGENPEANRGKGATTMKGDGAEALWKVQLSEYEQLVETSDLVVYNWFASWCRHVCQKYGVKSLGIWPVPFTATSEFPSFLFCSPKMKKVSSKLSHAQSHLFWESVFWKSSKTPLLKWRKENGLRTPLGVNTVAWEQRGHFSLPGSIMYCFSPQVVPRPLDWPGSVELCGYIRQQQSPKSLPHALDDLGLGEDETCRIHIGFGSATKSIPRPEKLLKTLILGIQKAMKKTAFKVLLCRKLAVEAGNWVPNEFITIVDYIPYESLLSRVDIHIHHGGSGTFGASLHGGCAQIIFPLEFDNFYWAERGCDLKVSTTLFNETATVDDVSEAIAQTAKVTGRAKSLARALAKEDGCDTCKRRILCELGI